MFMYCNKCHKELPDGSGFCGYCGSKQEIEVGDNQSYQEPVKKKKNTKELSTKKIIILIIFTVVAVVILFCRKLLHNSELYVPIVKIYQTIIIKQIIMKKTLKGQILQDLQ